MSQPGDAPRTDDDTEEVPPAPASAGTPPPAGWYDVGPGSSVAPARYPHEPQPARTNRFRRGARALVTRRIPLFAAVIALLVGVGLGSGVAAVAVGHDGDHGSSSSTDTGRGGAGHRTGDGSGRGGNHP